MFLRGGAGLVVAFALVFVLLVPTSAQAELTAACTAADVSDSGTDHAKPADQAATDAVTGFDEIDITGGCLVEDASAFGVVMTLAAAPAPSTQSQTWSYTVAFKNTTGGDVACTDVRGQTSPGTTGGCTATLTGSNILFSFPRALAGRSGGFLGDLVLSSGGVFITATGAVLTSSDRAPDSGVAFARAQSPYIVGSRAGDDLDSDADGVPDPGEIRNGTDPSSPDSDHDGLLDGGSRSESAGSANATALSEMQIHVLSDDGNTITFAGEEDFGTNATRPDTDADGLLDGPNIRAATGGPISASFANHSLTPISSDGSEDLFLGELEYGSEPTNLDTDADGLTDREEVTGSENGDYADKSVFPEFPGSTDPTRPDSDGDGLSDAEEVQGSATSQGETRTFSPLNPNDEDTDLDGLTDYEEVFGRATVDGREVIFDPTDPTKPDTDGDGATDYDEVRGNSDPNDGADTPSQGDQPGGAEASYLVLSTIAMLVVILLCVIGILVRWG